MNKKVLIIGGGSGGLACALFLNKAGIPCEIYEQAPEFSNVGASFILHPNGVNVIKQLGLLERFQENSHAITDYVFKDKEGNVSFKIESLVDDQTLINGFNYTTRANLIDVLFEEIQRREIPIHFGKVLSSFTQDDQSVTVKFEDGSEETGHILIGADGTNSKVRSQLFPYEYLRFNNRWAVFGMGEEGKLGKAEEFLKQDHMTTYFNNQSNITISKHHPSDKMRLSFIFMENIERKIPKTEFENKSVEEFKHEVANKFTDFEDPIKEFILNSSTFIPVQTFSVGLMDKFSLGRVALIGDALQTTDPYTGMGATLSLEDGLYLAKMLRDHQDYEDAFYYYEDDRKEIVRGIHESTKLMEQIEEASNNSIEDMLEGFDEKTKRKLIDDYINPPTVEWN